MQLMWTAQAATQGRIWSSGRRTDGLACVATEADGLLSGSVELACVWCARCSKSKGLGYAVYDAKSTFAPIRDQRVRFIVLSSDSLHRAIRQYNESLVGAVTDADSESPGSVRVGLPSPHTDVHCVVVVCVHDKAHVPFQS
jgi:hypothetical protein